MPRRRSGSSDPAGADRSGCGCSPARHHRLRACRSQASRPHRLGGAPIDLRHLCGRLPGSEGPSPTRVRPHARRMMFNGWRRIPDASLSRRHGAFRIRGAAAIPADGSESSVSLASVPDASSRLVPSRRSRKRKNTAWCRFRGVLRPRRRASDGRVCEAALHPMHPDAARPRRRLQASWSALAAHTKSLSVRPSMVWVHTSRRTRPQDRCTSG